MEAELARVRPSAWCVGATIREQGLSSDVSDWAGGVGVVAAPQRTSSCRRAAGCATGNQRWLGHYFSFEAEAEELHAHKLGHHLTTSFPAGGLMEQPQPS